MSNRLKRPWVLDCLTPSLDTRVPPKMTAFAASRSDAHIPKEPNPLAVVLATNLGEVGEGHIGNVECKSVTSEEICGIGFALENQPISAEADICHLEGLLKLAHHLFDKKPQPVPEHKNNDRSWAYVV
ncbi:hypothetical protein U1Q18_032770, partial [Sarracenia purpurea var. burkii]